MIAISGRMSAWLLLALDGRWSDIPSDQHEAIGAALRAAINSAPAAAQDKRLGETGCVVISQRALDEYLRQMQRGSQRFEFERARRELTDLCLDAKRVVANPSQTELTPRQQARLEYEAAWKQTWPASGDEWERWRVRSRATGVDLSFSVARSGRLCVVASIGQLRVAG